MRRRGQRRWSLFSQALYPYLRRRAFGPNPSGRPTHSDSGAAVVSLGPRASGEYYCGDLPRAPAPTTRSDASPLPGFDRWCVTYALSLSEVGPANSLIRGERGTLEAPADAWSCFHSCISIMNQFSRRLARSSSAGR